jgi:uncharacterized protein with LGFP repeats
LLTTVRHEFLRVYKDSGGPGGPLGLPGGDHKHVVGEPPEYCSGVSGACGEWQRFEGGTIASVKNRTYAVWGRIHDLWQSAGGVTGKLGYPMGPPVEGEQRFEGGVLRE